MSNQEHVHHNVHVSLLSMTINYNSKCSVEHTIIFHRNVAPPPPNCGDVVQALVLYNYAFTHR